MKIETTLFGAGVFFFVPLAIIYGIVTSWHEPVGAAALFLTGGLALLIGLFLWITSRRIDPRPEDDPSADISEGAGEQGVFAPYSWWPLPVRLRGRARLRRPGSRLVAGRDRRGLRRDRPGRVGLRVLPRRARALSPAVPRQIRSSGPRLAMVCASNFEPRSCVFSRTAPVEVVEPDEESSGAHEVCERRWRPSSSPPGVAGCSPSAASDRSGGSASVADTSSARLASAHPSRSPRLTVPGPSVPTPPSSSPSRAAR